MSEPSVVSNSRTGWIVVVVNGQQVHLTETQLARIVEKAYGIGIGVTR